MKVKIKKQTKSMIQELRQIRDKIGIEIKDMDYESLKKYVTKKSIFHPKRVWN